MDEVLTRSDIDELVEQVWNAPMRPSSPPVVFDEIVARLLVERGIPITTSLETRARILLADGLEGHD